MKDIAIIEFHDHESGDEGVIVIRAGRGLVALAVSLKHNGDIDIALNSGDSLALQRALADAIAVAREGP